MTQDAIVVRSARKRFSKSQPAILDGLNMTVPRGCIYGLLGASGCGKTTLLSCVVGVKELDSGEIWVLGGRPGQQDSGVPGPRVGYMPQEISLVKEFTVIGALYYFGRINGLEEDVIDERFEFFSDLLDLPPKNQLVKNMSGGQQRRVSFAAALMHRPELLILDEPTVGLDPILREKIWDYLAKITKEDGIAVVITTHYIEEAKLANRIGLMREGQLLAETTPLGLLSKFNCSSLEDAFLILSQRQHDDKSKGALSAVADHQQPEQPHLQESNSLVHNSNVSSLNDVRGSTDCIISKNEKQMLATQYRHKRNRRSANPFTAASGKVFKALLIKNILQFIRHPGGVLFAFIFPLIQTSLFFYTVGHDPRGLVMAVVNEEAGNCRAGNNTGAVVYSKDQRKCEYVDISCRFLKGFDESIMVKKYFETIEEATLEVQRGKASGTMHFARNFSKALMKRRDSFNAIRHSEADIIASEIETKLDMSDGQIGFFLQKSLFERFIEIHADIMAACNIPKKYVYPPIRLEEPLYATLDREYSDFVAPGFMLTLVFFLATAVSSSIIIADRAEGVWDRSLVQGVTTPEILFSHILTQLSMIVIQVTVVLVIIFGHFKLACEGPFAAIVGLVFLTGVCGMFYGFLISVFCNSQTIANFMATGSFYPIIMLSGALWPLEGMSPYIRWLSYLMPTTVSTYSMRCVMDKGYGFSHPDVYSGFLITLAWIVITIFACLIGIRNNATDQNMLLSCCKFDYEIV